MNAKTYLGIIRCLLLLLFLNSCSRSLSVRTDYFTNENLASFYIGTPDPHLHRPFVNQRLIISWHLSENDVKEHDVRLKLTVRLKNLKEEKIVEPIHLKNGYYIYQLDQETLHCSGGIATYKIEIFRDDCLLQSWIHPLWAELIQFNIPEAQADVQCDRNQEQRE